MAASRSESAYQHGAILCSVLRLLWNYNYFIAGSRFKTCYATLGESGWMYSLTTLDTKEEKLLIVGEKEINTYFRLEKD